MATMLATANQPDPVTGITQKAMAWQVTTAAPGDVMTCLVVVGTAGYDGWVKSKSDPNSPLTGPVVWSVVIMSGDYLTARNINNTVSALVNDWVFFDGSRVWKVNPADAAANWTMTQWVHP